MKLSEAPAFVAAKMAMLAEARAAAAARADQLTTKIAHLRDRLDGRVLREGDTAADLNSDIRLLLAEQKRLQDQRPIEMAVIDNCKTWLASLPAATVLEPLAAVVEEGLPLSEVRDGIRKRQASVSALKRVPVPAADTKAKVQAYVEGLGRPVIGGIGTGETLTVRWPTEWHALVAFLQPELLAERVMMAIDRITNTPCSLPERKQRIAKLEDEIEQMMRIEEAIVVDTGAPREPRRPPWVVLGVKAV
jgi:hypothetical protein